MARIPINNVGTVGIVTDLPANELPPNAWSDGQNVAFRDGLAGKIPGHVAYFTPTFGGYWLLPYAKNGNLYWIYAGLTNVSQYQGGSSTSISKSAGAYNATAALRWNGGILGDLPILNNGVDVPQKWADVSGNLADLSNWLYGSWTTIKAKVIRPFKTFLVALDIEKDNGGGTNPKYPHMVKWSQPADPGEEPDSWDETDTTKLTGENSLSQTPGHVIDCLPLGNVNMIYKEDSIWSMQYVGGQFIFNFDMVNNEHGILSRDCMAQFKDRQHFVLTRGDAIIHNGNTAESVIDAKMRKALFSNIDSTNYVRSFVVPNWRHDEIWCCIPEEGNDGVTLAYIWNYKQGSWSVREMPLLAYATQGIADADTAGTDFASDTGTFDGGASGTFDELSYNPTLRNIVGTHPGAYGGDSRTIYTFDEDTAFNTKRISSYLERTGLHFDQPSVVKECLGIWPRVREGSVSVYVGAAMELGDSYTWEGPYTYTAGDTYLITTRVAGRYIGVRFESNTKNSTWSIDGYDLEVIESGER